MVKKSDKNILKKINKKAAKRKEILKQVQDDAVVVQDDIVVVQSDKLAIQGDKAKIKADQKALIGKYNLGGRPRAYLKPFDMAVKISEYLEATLGNKQTVTLKNGEVKEISTPLPVSIEGMCAHLGITNQTLNDYEKNKPVFTEVIIAAKAWIKKYYVESGITTPAGHFIKFLLINSFKEDGWEDKSAIDNKHSGFVTSASLEDVEKEDIIALAERFKKMP